jgi:NAD(P)-dependent dehydrogenase (short-subunit alcohol dehydrogenase family)
MPTRLAGRIALITGAAGGIGSSMCRLFAGEGCRVVAADLDFAAASALAEDIRQEGGAATATGGDISRAAEVEEMFARAREAYGDPDILVNNAFFNVNDVALADLAEEDWDRTIDVCLKGPFLCTRAALPAMKRMGRGAVVTLSSVNALLGVGETAYTAAKGGLISMMRLVASEYGEFGIRSNVICPATIGTKICLDYWHRFPAGFERLQSMYPLGRIGQPADVANLALFLASDEAAWITGQVYVIDGGLLAGKKLEVE